MIFIEKGFHDYLLVGSAMQYNALIRQYIAKVKCFIKPSEEEDRSTALLFSRFFNENNKAKFMDPDLMSTLSAQLSNEIISTEDLQTFWLDIFGDSLEALVGAVFIDSNANMRLTQKIVMELLEPYLYVYGSCVLDKKVHPRTEAIDKWALDVMANIVGNQIQITHLTNEEKDPETGQLKSVYRGYLGNIEVVQESFFPNEMNKQR